MKNNKRPKTNATLKEGAKMSQRHVKTPRWSHGHIYFYNALQLWPLVVTYIWENYSTDKLEPK
jgi:hypothetical protein